MVDGSELEMGRRYLPGLPGKKNCTSCNMFTGIKGVLGMLVGSEAG